MVFSICDDSGLTALGRQVFVRSSKARQCDAFVGGVSPLSRGHSETHRGLPEESLVKFLEILMGSSIGRFWQRKSRFNTSKL